MQLEHIPPIIRSATSCPKSWSRLVAVEWVMVGSLLLVSSAVLMIALR